jgi:hypothetical protein
VAKRFRCLNYVLPMMAGANEDLESGFDGLSRAFVVSVGIE